MTDQTAPGNYVKQLFSPPVLAALRYLLTAVSPLLAIVGVVALSPTQIDRIIAVAQQVGVVLGALAAFIGVLAPIAAAAWGTFKSTQAQQVKSVEVIAKGPASDVSQNAKVALIDATAAQPEVVGKINVTDQTLVDATQSTQVQKAR